MSLFEPIEITPRDYQQRCIESTVNSWGESPGALARMMTGGGKTIVGSLIIQQWLRRGDNFRAIILAHERQLIWQFAQEIEEVLGIAPDIEMGNIHATGKALITVASRQTLHVKENASGAQVSRLFKFDPNLNWLVVCDEAHRWARKLTSVAPIIEHFEKNPSSRRLGLTATPERSDGTTLESLFPHVASDYRLYAPGEPNAVDDGWAVAYEQHFVEVEGVDFKNIKTVAGDFSDDELEKVLAGKESLAKLITPTMEIVGDRSTLIFSPTVAMARMVSHQINAELGYDAAKSLDGSIAEQDRKEAYRGHQRGDYQFLSVCGLCREGYNDPNIGAVAIFRPTKSRALAEQMKGRGCRPLKGLVDGIASPLARKLKIEKSEKPSCIIVDLVGITGLADCASTAELFAAGRSDEVVDWANKLMLAGQTDVRKALDQAEVEVKAAERRRALAAKARRMEREKRDAERRAQIEADVRYQSTRVAPGGSQEPRNEFGDILATQKQKGFMRWKRIPFDPQITKVEAIAVIGAFKNGGMKAVKSHLPAGQQQKQKKDPPKKHRASKQPQALTLDEVNRLLMER